MQRIMGAKAARACSGGGFNMCGGGDIIFRWRTRCLSSSIVKAADLLSAKGRFGVGSNPVRVMSFVYALALRSPSRMS